MALVSSYQYWMKYDWTPVFKSGRGRREGGVGNQLCPLKPVKAELSGGSGDEARGGRGRCGFWIPRVIVLRAGLVGIGFRTASVVCVHGR